MATYVGVPRLKNAYIGLAKVSKIYIDTDVVYQAADYLTFTAKAASTIYLKNTNNTPNCEYYDPTDTEHNKWPPMPTASATALTLAAGQSLKVRGKNPSGFSTGSGKYSMFTMTGAVEASGNVMTLIDYENEVLEIPCDYCFYKLFSPSATTNRVLLTAPSMPATTLKRYCYYMMYSYQTKLHYFPPLPLVTLSSACASCYLQMFSNCSALYISQDSGPEAVLTIPSGAGTTYYTNMFVSTGGSFIGSPIAGHTYYVTRNDFLTFTATQANSTIGMDNSYRTSTVPTISKSTDGGLTWTTWDQTTPITLANVGDSVALKSTNASGFNLASDDYSKFTMTGGIKASGSVMSLIDGRGGALTVPAGYCFINLFKGCTALTVAPKLPATTLTAHCYENMFYNTGLTIAPSLPATATASYCYKGMFSSCTSLSSTSSISATSLAPYSCYEMFKGCTALVSPSDISATTFNSYSCYSMFEDCTNLVHSPITPMTSVTSYCFCRMFYRCRALVSAPALPATTLANGCYKEMFRLCSSITSAPSLPAGTMKSYCYYGMFAGTSLTVPPALNSTSLAEYCYGEMFVGCPFSTAPQLPATTLASYCYFMMFAFCTNLKVWPASVETGTPFFTYTTQDPLVLVPAVGMFTNTGGIPPEPQVGYTYYYYTGPEPSIDYLTFTARTAGSTVCLECPTQVQNSPNIYYSMDDGDTWTQWDTTSQYTTTLTLQRVGDKVMFRGRNPRGFNKKYIGSDPPQYSTFVMTGSISASGNIMTLIDVIGVTTTIPTDMCFMYLFYQCAALRDAPDLPATTLTAHCYDYMFQECTDLRSAPYLPATTLTYYCYRGMFYGCSSLFASYYLSESNPVIFTCPSTGASGCVSGMFRNTGLTTTDPEQGQTWRYHT